MLAEPGGLRSDREVSELEFDGELLIESCELSVGNAKGGKGKESAEAYCSLFEGELKLCIRPSFFFIELTRLFGGAAKLTGVLEALSLAT